MCFVTFRTLRSQNCLCSHASKKIYSSGVNKAAADGAQYDSNPPRAPVTSHLQIVADGAASLRRHLLAFTIAPLCGPPDMMVQSSPIVLTPYICRSAGS